MKKHLLLLPEFVILILAAYWFLDNYFGANHFNGIALALFLIVIFQIIFKKKLLGMIIASVILLFSLYMIKAVFSEFRNFKIINSEAMQLLFFGLLFCFLGMFSSGLLFYKYAASPKKYCNS